MIRVELVDAAVNEIMSSTFDVPVMQHEIVYGNEAEIEAELERVRFELTVPALIRTALPPGEQAPTCAL
jgi:hypothetical protein